MGTGGNMTMPATLVNSGTIQSNICASISTNIQNINHEASFTIHPNPFEEKVSISVAEHVQIKSIKIYNIFGQEVYSQIKFDTSLSSNKIVLDLKELKTGIFLCELQAENFHQVLKLVKQ